MITEKVIFAAGFIQSTLDKSSRQYNLFGYHTSNCGIRTLDPRSVDSVVFTLRGQPEEYGHALEVDDHKEVDFRR